MRGLEGMAAEAQLGEYVVAKWDRFAINRAKAPRLLRRSEMD